MLRLWRGIPGSVSVRRTCIGRVAFNHAGVSDVFSLCADSRGIADEVLEVVESESFSGFHLVLLISSPPPLRLMRQPLLNDDAAVVKSIKEMALFERRGGGVGGDELHEELDMCCMVPILDGGARRQLPNNRHDRITPCAKHFVKF